MRIAFFTDAYLPTIDGVVISITNAAKTLAKKGHNVMLFAPTGCYLPDEMKKLGIKLYTLKSFRLKSYKEYKIRIPTFSHVLKIAKQFNPDIIHVHSPGGIGLEGVYCAKKLKIPVIATSHTVFSGFVKHVKLLGIEKMKFTEEIVWHLLRKFFNSCNAIISPSQPMKDELIAYGIEKPIHVISNGIDTKKFHVINIKKKSDLVHVGRLSYAKNIDVIIKALKILADKGIKPSLTIAGRGPEMKNLKKFSSLNKLNVKFLGAVSHGELVKIYNSAEIFVTASTIETEGIVLLEAMACGKPIIAVKALAIPSIVKNNVNGLLSEPFNSEEIAKNIEKLLKNKTMIKKMSKKSAEFAKKYDLNIVNNQLESLYHSLVKHRSK